jgi:DNA polymerase III subunit delta'
MGQDQPIRLLNIFLQKARIPHALLFTGLDGIGKRTAAGLFAMAMNCEKRSAAGGRMSTGTGANTRPALPCMQCKSCRRIESGNHPDILRVEPAGTAIKIDQIRDLGATLAMKPYAARTRVVIMAGAHSMNSQAGNALLKILEEPPAGTILILTAPEASGLLPTIVSRCQAIPFRPLPPETIRQLLVTHQGMQPQEAEILAPSAGGSYAKAVAMGTSDWIQRRNWLLDQLEKLPSRSLRTALGFAERLSQNRPQLADSLEIIKLWLRDLIYSHLYPGGIVSCDLATRLEGLAHRDPPEALLAKVDAVEKAQRDIQANVNVRLALEIMALRLNRH